ncbi:MAG: PAS domain-containing protein, partial [Acetobacteraceae bacterium]|nr:PAS domain-containing protein [Acetobacteraceae bacterium]
RLRVDEAYRSFYRLLDVTIANALATVRAREDERRRAEALAEIDRAKTLFFSNVSHEFRTPLTLMLGPLEEVIARPSLASEDRRLLTVAHRDGLRLLRLVNALLDFSRVEAGRAQASYEPTDLAAVTAELVSSFQSACEAAGLALAVDCPPLPEPVFVDRDMWEKIVLNLVSNAFEFTFNGEVAVAVRAEDGMAVFTVRDTGTGIPEGELPRVFERFHRVENARGRTYEGTGIGLALVRELVRLHGGTVAVESALGQGTAFTVRVPFGTAHLPAGRIEAGRTLASTATRAEAFVKEALQWLPPGGGGEPAATEEILPQPMPAGAEGAAPPCVLLTEDNADMRDYVRRLLGAHYAVETVADGEAALEAVERHRPDLVLADVMMPRLDGLGLLKAVRARPDLRELPVVVLSARAGEEAKVEGLDAGADDYLVKPFGAQELLARVAANLGMARLRRRAAEAVRESEQRFRALVTATSYVVYRMSPDWTEMRRLEGRGFLADTEHPSRTWLDEYIYPDDQPLVRKVIEQAIRTKGVFELDHRVRRADGSVGWTLSRAVPLLDEAGEITEWFGAASDITEQKREAVEALRESRERLRTLVEGVPQLVWRTTKDGDWTWASPQWASYTGQPEPESHGRGWLEAVQPEDRDACLAAWRDADAQGLFRAEHRLRHAGEDRFRWVQSQALPVRDEEGRIVEWLGTTTDVEDLRRRHEERILIAELQHRTRNLLTVVNGVADQTLAASASLDEFGAHFDQRLAALGRVQGLLSREVAPNVTVDELLRLELAAHGVDAGDTPRVRLSGSKVVLPPAPCSCSPSRCTS